MSHHKKHKVVIHGWIHGKLKKFEYEFETLKEAAHFAKGSKGHSTKIYTDNELIEHIQHGPEIIELPTLDRYA